MTVNVLNGQVETFETKPINVEVMSITGDISTMVSACIVDRVTGNMLVVEWNKLKQQWSHLRNIDFPTSATRPIVNIVNMLLGLDCADLLYTIQEVRGKPGEPMGRQGQLLKRYIIQTLPTRILLKVRLRLSR